MDWVTPAVYAGMLLILLLGPGLASYFPIRNAKAPAERRFMIGCAVYMWAVCLALCVVPWLLSYHEVIPG